MGSKVGASDEVRRAAVDSSLNEYAVRGLESQEGPYLIAQLVCEFGSHQCHSCELE